MRNLGNVFAEQLSETLPEGWTVHFSSPGEHRQFDGWLEVCPPCGQPIQFAVKIKQRFEPRNVDQIERSWNDLPAVVPTLVISPFLSERSRDVLKASRISYADLTGNTWLSEGQLFIDRSGATKNPERAAETSARTSLRGPITARVVRFLCDMFPPFKVREIADSTHAHAGNVSRILEFLEREHFVERNLRGLVISVDWESLLRRWSQDVQKERHVETFLEPRGIEPLVHRLSQFHIQYAVTGGYAAAQLAPVATSTAIDVYVQDIDEARVNLSLRGSDRIGNVRLIQAFDRVVFERTIIREDVILASPSQIAADLLTLPKRSSDEVSALIDWMKQNEQLWRGQR